MKTIYINDAIHKAIALSLDEGQVIDHAFMQRLRFIRQLGFVSSVYPSATHDRFSHSLGTLHVASLFAEQLLTNDEYSVLARLLDLQEKEFLRRIIRLSALLHDVGHAPFSHTAETVMPHVSELAIPESWISHPRTDRRARHEDYSVLLLNGMSEGPHAVISKEDAEIIASLVHHKFIRMPDSWGRHFRSSMNTESLHRLVKTIISSDIDADRMDYLLRDAHFAGVSYGHFDIQWLLSNLGSVANGDGYTISISESGIHALEHYLLARYNMYAQVYMHKTVKCFDYYFHKAIDEKEITYAIPPQLDLYVAMRDSTLIELLFDAAARDSSSWSGRLMAREPAKRIARIWGDQGEVEPLFKHIQKELDSYGIRPFLHFTKRKFLDLPHEVLQSQSMKEDQSLFSGLATMPIVVVRKQFGVISSAPLSDYSFILKKYHHDLSVGDIYILKDQYEARKKTINAIIKKFHTHSPTETILEAEK